MLSSAEQCLSRLEGSHSDTHESVTALFILPGQPDPSGFLSYTGQNKDCLCSWSVSEALNAGKCFVFNSHIVFEPTDLYSCNVQFWKYIIALTSHKMPHYTCKAEGQFTACERPQLTLGPWCKLPAGAGWEEPAPEHPHRNGSEPEPWGWSPQGAGGENFSKCF